MGLQTKFVGVRLADALSASGTPFCGLANKTKKMEKTTNELLTTVAEKMTIVRIILEIP